MAGTADEEIVVSVAVEDDTEEGIASAEKRMGGLADVGKAAGAAGGVAFAAGLAAAMDISNVGFGISAASLGFGAGGVNATLTASLRAKACGSARSAPRSSRATTARWSRKGMVPTDGSPSPARRRRTRS